jgi:hypothetical protein
MPKTKAAVPSPPRVVEPLWTPGDLVAYFADRVTEKTLANWRAAGMGPPFVKVGSAVLYRPAAARSWTEAQERNARDAA